MLRSRFLSRFAREEKGNLAVESLILIPGLWLVFLVMVTIFDAYQQSNANQKASYAISDLVSRQTTPVDEAFLAGAKGLFDTLAYRANDTTVRITSVRWDAADNEFKLHWSEANGFKSGATASDVAQWNNLLPVVPDQEYITVVETWSDFDPAFNVGFNVSELHNFVFTRPRYAPRVCWETCS